MLVSVVIPTRNRGSLLNRAVESVLSQTHTEIEVIVVDDGSTDKSTHSLQRIFFDSRLKVVRQEPKGVAAARNAGISLARGEMIALLDSDDVWKRDKIRRQLGFMLNTGFQVSQSEEAWIRHGTRVNPGRKHSKRAGWIFEPSLELCLVSPSSAMFTLSFWRQVGAFDSRLMACEDYDFWLRASLRYPFGLFPEELVYKYGGHSDQLSRKIIGLDLYRIYSLLGILRREELSGEQRNLLHSNLRKRLQRYAQGCLKRDKPEEAERVLRMCGREGVG